MAPLVPRVVPLVPRVVPQVPCVVPLVPRVVPPGQGQQHRQQGTRKRAGPRRAPIQYLGPEAPDGLKTWIVGIPA